MIDIRRHGTGGRGAVTATKTIEIRWHGRGGQGAVTAAKLLAAAALREGKHFQAFPEYGPERRGAPVQAFTRISDEPIRIYTSVKSPSVVVVLDPSLLGKVPVTDGLTEDGVIIANYAGSSAELRKKLGLADDTKLKVYAIDASTLAMRRLGRPIPNTPMLGALVGATGLVEMDALVAELEHSFGGRFRPELVKANVEVMREACQEVLSE